MVGSFTIFFFAFWVFLAASIYHLFKEYYNED